MIPYFSSFVNVQLHRRGCSTSPSGVFSFYRRHCSVKCDEGVQPQTAKVFNWGAIFSELALKTRDRLGLTQKAMSELLSMSENSYCDIENGTYMCGTLTAILLLSMQEYPNSVLSLRKKLDELYAKEMQPI